MLVNQLNLPEPFVRATEAALYSKGDARYSVTELIEPARIGALRRFYVNDIVEDVADNVASLMGTMFHKLLEAAGAPTTHAILEERLYADIEGVTISGAMDHTILWDNGCLDDYKATKVYSVQTALRYGKPDWTAQLNIYRWLRSLLGQTIEKLRIIAWMKDWFIARAIAAAQGERPDSYPQHEILAIDIPVWPLEQTEAYIRGRIIAHKAADEWAAATNGGVLLEVEGVDEPRCTDEDRWRNKTRWACMKESRKTALKLYDTEAEARYAASQEKGGYVEQRGGEYRRCALYCNVGRAGLCSQWEADKAVMKDNGHVIDTSAFDE